MLQILFLLDILKKFFTACCQIKWSLICSIGSFLYEAWICCFLFSLAIGHKSYELITHALCSLVRETYIIVVLRNFIGQELLWMQIR